MLPFFVLIITIADAKIPKDTADYYTLNAERYLGKNAQLYIEDITLAGTLENHPELTEFTSLTWHGTDSFGIAHILVDTKEAERFYKKYHAPDGYEQSNSIGTKSNEGWKAKRLHCLFVKSDGQFYFYVGNTNPFISLKGNITLKNMQGKAVTCKILEVRGTKVKIQRTDNQVFFLELTKLDGDSQRLVRNWQRK
jgi:hypothetical protein